MFILVIYVHLCLSHGASSDELHFLDLPVTTFTARTRRATPVIVNHSYPLRIPLVRNMFGQFLPANRSSLEPTPKRIPPDHYNLKCLNSNVIFPTLTVLLIL